MQKKILLLTPLLVVALLFSCNNKSKVDPNQVNEQEMLDAFTMKGVDYLQVNIYRESPDYGTLNIFSPSCFHQIFKDIGHYRDFFVIKNSDNYKKYERYDEKLDFVEVHCEPSDFRAIADIVNDFLQPIKDKEYKDFTYSEENKEYLVDYIEDDKNEHCALKFLDKKLISFNAWFIDESREQGRHYDITYNQIEPPNPPEVILTKPTKIITTINNHKIETNLIYNEHLWPITTEEYEYEDNKLIRHSITEQTYDEYDNPITYRFVENDIEISRYTTTYQYTDSHKIQEQTSKGVKDKNPFNDKYIFTYDKLDRELSHEYFTINLIDDEPLPSSKYEYTYLNNYQKYISMKYLVYKIDKYEVDTTTTQELDNKGRVITNTEYKGEHNQEDYQKQTTYTYDQYNCVLEVTVNEPPFKDVTTNTYYKNNPYKVLTSHTIGYVQDSTILYESNETNEYDNHDRLIKTTYDQDPIHRTIEYIYE